MILAGCSVQENLSLSENSTIESATKCSASIRARDELAMPCVAAHASSLEPISTSEFAETIRPLLMQYCADCHAPGEADEDRDFLMAETETDVVGLRDVYASVVQLMEDHAMPPEDAAQPTDPERKLVIDWIKETLPPEESKSVQEQGDTKISAFVRRIFQDKQGHLWFGTNGDGVVRYDGDALEYFSINEGFGGLAVRGIVEDKQGDLWFGTERGITKYDGKSFTNFTEQDGLINNDVWSIIVDSKGIIWIGTLQGVSHFDGETFTPFDLPEAEPDHSRGVTSARIVHCIMEDSQGRMWFTTNGGAYIYDPSVPLRPGGDSLTNISETDGLCHNSVNSILEDKAGNFWFATHHNGVCRWDGTSFTHFTSEDGVNGTEAWSLYEDSTGNIWFPIENSGVYRYDGESFTNFQSEQGLTTNAIQCTFEDKEGRIWLGGWMGLFRYDGNSIFAVGKNGPWQ
ncbi:MAG: two-component regulator propeller domain-containing protein [Pirellulaceae bacterium]